MVSVFVWLLMAVVTIVLEIVNPGIFLCLSLSFGALAAAISTLLSTSFLGQLGIATGISVASCLYLNYWVKKTDHATKHLNTNAQAMVGKKCFVTQDITPLSFGYVKIDGQLWAARAIKESSHFREGEEVCVLSISGAHVVVDKSITHHY